MEQTQNDGERQDDKIRNNRGKKKADNKFITEFIYRMLGEICWLNNVFFDIGVKIYREFKVPWEGDEKGKQGYYEKATAKSAC